MPPQFLREAQELVSLGSRKVIITDLLNGTQYAPGKFRRTSRHGRARILHIAVKADLITDARIPGYERPKVMALLNRITKELEEVGARDAIVSVRNSLT